MRSTRLKLSRRHSRTFSSPLTAEEGTMHGAPPQERSLVERRQGFNMEFESLVVLAFDLEFGLQFFDQEFQARDFGF